MNLLNARYFLETAKALNFTRAAETLNISQQALSAHIAALEKEFGAELFERGTPLTLTQAGLVFQRYAQKFAGDYDELLRELSDIRDDHHGMLVLSIAHTRGRILLPRILPSFRREFPQVDVRIYEGNNDELRTKMDEGKLELLICKLPVLSPNTVSEKFYTEHTVLLASDSLLKEYFGKDKEKVVKKLTQTSDVGLLRELPFMLPHEGDIMRSVADELVVRAGFVPKVTVEAENIETLLEMAVRGMGVTFYPQLFIDCADFIKLPKNLRALPLNDQAASYDIGFCYQRGRYLPFAAREFIRIAKENISL